MKILDIRQDSVVDGEGLRTVIFFAGCNHHCKECHNPQSWDFNNGIEMTVEEIITEIKSNPLCQGVTFSGGCPICNASEILPLAIQLKKEGYNIWCYSGETLEQIMLSLDSKSKLLEYCDVLVDGAYIHEKRDLSLAFRGSSNQRILIKGKDY